MINKEVYKSEDAKETISKNEIFSADRVDTIVTAPVDRSESERGIENNAKSEIETGERLEKIRKELGINAGENKEVYIRIEALIKKMSLPFNDPKIDKKRQELLLGTEEKMNKIIEELEKNDNETAAVKEERKSLVEKIEQLIALKDEKEKELKLLKTEAQEYVDKTKPPIIRVSTKERLARAKGITQYFNKKETHSPLFEEYGFGGNVDNARSGFNEAQKKDDEINRIDGEFDSTRTRITVIDDLDLGELEKYRQEKLKLIEIYIEWEKESLKILETEQRHIDERKERLRELKELLVTLLSQKEEKPININPLVAEKQKVAQERSERNIINTLDSFLRYASNGNLEKVGIKSEIEAIEKLREELKKVQKSASIMINVSSERLPKVLEDGKFKSTLELPLEYQRDKPDYGEYRVAAEKYLGVHASGTENDPFAIVGALASKNGYDESHGAADPGSYGRIFVNLKPEVLNRCVFVDGDSIVESSFYGDVPGSEPGLNKKDAMIAKAMRNIVDEADGRMGQELKYVEAEILGGVSLNDIESINIPITEFLEEYNKTMQETQRGGKQPILGMENRSRYFREYYEKSKKLAEDIKSRFPQYAHLIKEI